MRFKHSVSITVDCFTDVFKLFLYRLIVGIIFYSLMYLILSLGLHFIVASREFAAVSGLAGEFLRTLSEALSGNTAVFAEFESAAYETIAAFATLLATHIGNIVGSVIGVVIVFIVQRIVNGLAQFAIGSSVNDRMGTYSRTRFAVSYFKNIAKAVLYELVYVPLAFIYDVGSFLACWFLFFYIPYLLPSWGVLSVLVAIGFTVFAMVCLQALKLTVISAWMPAMVVGGKSLFGGLKESFRMKERFGRRFAGYFVACYLIVFVNVGFALFTAGSGLFFTVPLSFLFLIVMQFVNYYESTGVKYFLAKDKVWDSEESKIIE